MVIAEMPQSKTASPTREMLAVQNPVTAEVIGQIPLTTTEEVQEAVKRARQAQIAWGALSPKERTRYLRRWADLLWERQAEGIAIIRRETGKAEGGALLELMTADNTANFLIHNTPKILKQHGRLSVFPFVQRAHVIYKPYGVVGVISPWNYPFLLAILDGISALMAGNAVVFKPSEITPFSMDFAVELMHEAGFPKDLVQVVHGDGRTGSDLVDAADFIAFTGSTAVGRKIAVKCAEQLKPYGLELGGKDPAIVLQDANIDLTAAALLRGAFENAGQVCMSIERAYIEAPIYDQLLERVIHFAPNLKVSAQGGMDVHMGSMTNIREVERTERHIADAVSKGAKVVFGGKRRPDLGPLFFEPTILVDVDHTMDIMREETFGPTLPIMKVKNTDEAIRLANDSQYGLAASVFTKDLAHGQDVAHQLVCGDVSINRSFFVIGTPSLPSGGQRESGVGRRNGREGLLKYVSTQSTLTDNLLGQTTNLGLAEPFVLQAFSLLRKVRRYVSFI